MSDMRRMTGSGKPAYVWQNHKNVKHKAVRHESFVDTVSFKPGMLLKAIWAVSFAAMLTVTILSYMQYNRYKDDFKAAQTAAESYNDQIEQINILIEYERSEKVVCQRAEQQLYMSASAETQTKTVSVPAVNSIQTAQK